MNTDYGITKISEFSYGVVKTVTIYGERLSAYDSEPNKSSSEIIYSGNISDCKAYLDCIKSNLFIK